MLGMRKTAITENYATERLENRHIVDNDIILVRIASHRNFASVCFTVVAGKAHLPK